MNTHVSGAVVDAVPAARARPGRRASRPVPERADVFAHLTLPQLRAYRSRLSDEEGRVSYWRRILQARLDVLRAGGVREVDTAALAPVLTDERVGAGRRALVDVLPVDDIPPLPALGELWDRRVEPGDVAALAEFEDELVDAERQLSDYRRALHARIADATAELIARYREQPALCLSALPLPEARRARG